MGKAAAVSKRVLFFGLVLTLVILVAVLNLVANPKARLRGASSRLAKTSNELPKDLAELLTLKRSELPQLDVTLMNLFCAQGLPGAEGLNVQACLETLNGWTQQVNFETKRHLYRYRSNPGEFNNSEAYFRVLMLITVLQQDFNVHYNPVRIRPSDSPEPDDAFFADSRDLFLHGILASRAMGTCVSMPVFYVAVGRRLGYPMKLVTTRDHLFARWESADGKERFNIEGTNQGLNTPDDDYYKTWPRPLTDEEIRAAGYLKSLTPAEELAVFLQTRGNCLRVAGFFDAAAAAYEQAQSLAPGRPAGQISLASGERGRSQRAFSHAELDEMADYANRVNEFNSSRMQLQPGLSQPLSPTPPIVTQP